MTGRGTWSRAGAAAAALGLAGCGTNQPELPPGLGVAESCVAVGYPDGPYATEPGGAVENACFQGWPAPATVSHGPETLEPMALSDYYDPEGRGRVKLLLVNTAALWCSACRIEHETLPEHYAELAPRGLEILSALFEDNMREPADLDDLKVWVETFDTTFPIALDPSYSFGLYASAETAPLNLILETRTMTILRKFIGDQSAVIWPYVETELERRGSE